jgi:hypothetical protein
MLHEEEEKDWRLVVVVLKLGSDFLSFTCCMLLYWLKGVSGEVWEKAWEAWERMKMSGGKYSCFNLIS